MLEHFNKKNFRKQIKKSLELKIKKKEKAINYMLNGKALIILLTVGLIKKHSINEYFSELKSSGGRVKVELDLSHYAIKADLKNAKGFDTSKLD